MAEAGSEKISSNAVKGMLSPREALARMISGTGLEVRVTGDLSAIIVRNVSAGLRSTAFGKDERDYDAVLQNMVMTKLCQDAVTRPGQYRAALDLWVTSFGRVEWADLLNSTGDPVRDRRIVTALNGLRPVPPPAGLAQPTTMLVLPGPAATEACEALLAGGKVTTP
jgi:TonB family protein